MLGLTAKDKAFIAKRKAKQAAEKAASKRKHKTTFEFAHKKIQIESSTKKGIEVLRNTASRIRKNKKAADKLSSQLKYKRQKGQKVLKSEEKKLAALRKAVQKDTQKFEVKTYELGSNSVVKASYYKGGKKSNGIAAKITRTPTTLNADSANSTIYARIELLIPYMSDSGSEYGIGDFTTVVIGGLKGHTVGELLQRQTGLLIGEDFVVKQLFVKDTINFFGD